MTTTNPISDPLQQLLDNLAGSIQNLESDDLSRLAKLHGQCETLAELTDEGSEHPNAELRRAVLDIVPRLESLVLGAAEQPSVTLGEICELIAKLTAGATDEPAPSASADRSDADVAAQLDKVFDEPTPVTTEPADDVDVVTEPAAAESDPPPAGGESPAEPPYESEPLKLNPNELEFVKGFVEEATEHIEGIESAVLEVEQAPDDTDKINDLFRPFHTIKGMAGFLNLRDVNRLTHEAETLLDQGRRGERTVTAGLIDLIFDVVDILKAQVAAIASHLAEPHGDTVPQPPVGEMIDKLRSVIANRITLDARQTGPGQPDQKIGENLVEQGSVPQEVVEYALEAQRQGQADKKTGEILIESKIATPKQVSQAMRPQANSTVTDTSVRIDTGKLDALVDMVGELVIAQTLVSTHPAINSDPNLTKDVGQVGKIVRDVQEVAMGMRMIPIGGTFQRMARLVRDVSRKAGKQVNLHISGEDTELDKNVIQQIGDPLVHMVRNAVDHGVETPEQRLAAGKPEVGNVYLNASHHGGNIVIEIRDDGKGLDRDKLIAKAVEKGLLTGEEELTDQQVFDLVFAAGFSTAAQVTDISGRGVGMDVVKRNIEQLRGRVEISSEKGQGSTFCIRLPLTLAIIDGMLVRVGGERFIIPTINIEQSLRPRPEQITTVQHRGEVLQVRGELVPLIQLGRLFGLADRVDPCETMVVIAHCDNRKIGIVLEELIGQQQVVIKTLGERFKHLRGICGAAILGDGRVGLILEMQGLEAAHDAYHAQCGSGPARDDFPRDQDSVDDQPPEAEIAQTPEPVLV